MSRSIRKVSREFSRQNKAARRRGYGPDHGMRRVVLPSDRPVDGVYGREVALGLLVERNASSHVDSSGDEAKFFDEGKRGTPIHRRDVEHIRGGIVCGAVPLDAPEYARTDVNAFFCERHFDVRQRGYLRFEPLLVGVAIEDSQDSVLSNRCHNVPLAPSDGRGETIHSRPIGTPVLSAVRGSGS